MMTDIEMMQLALELAGQGVGRVEPNPAVGCVIAKDGSIIGRGFHAQFGGLHAEVNALADCANNGHNPSGATLFVTLEPCSHTGKTPPCTRAVIDADIARVVIASADPTELAGGGIDTLRRAGVEVELGLCGEAAEKLNAPFYKHSRSGFPWVVVKWAQSIDGKLAWKNPPAAGNWISNAQSRSQVHWLRKRMGAILTGVDTVIADNPKLTVRIDGETIDRPPVPVVLDSQLRIPTDCNLMTTPAVPTLVVTTAQTKSAQVEKLRTAGAEVLIVGMSEGHCNLKETLALLGNRGIQQVLIEAGPTLIAAFLNQKLADEAHIYIAPMILGQNGTAPIGNSLSHDQQLKAIQIDTLATDIHIHGYL